MNRNREMVKKLTPSTERISAAMAEVIAESIVFELCNGADDDCDTLTDEAPVTGERLLQVVEQGPQVGRRDADAAQRMQAQAVETRLEIDGVGRRNPGGRAIACLAPHTQGSEPLLGVGQAQFVGKPVQQLPGLGVESQLRLSQPGPQ